ncbi:MAG: HK97 family phage prohead protease [Caldilineaceae bacterium]
MKHKLKRAGRVLSANNERKLQDAVDSLESACDSIRGVLEQLGEDEGRSDMKVKELRFFTSVELRMEEVDSKPMLRGYAALYNQLSVDFGGWREIIRPGAFTSTLANGPDVRALVEHEGGLSIIGRTRNGTLRLREDVKGLAVEIEPPDTQAGRDITTLVRRGDLDQMSFAFWTKRDNWLEQEEYVLRELFEVDIDGGDVAVVTYPAYPQTSVQTRSLMNLPEIPNDLRPGPDSDRAAELVVQVRQAQRKRRLQLLAME